MEEINYHLSPRQILLLVLWLLSLIHVGYESVKMKRVGRPFWHILLVAVAWWPVSYFMWVFVWPGTLRKTKAQLESEKWVERISARSKEKREFY